MPTKAKVTSSKGGRTTAAVAKATSRSKAAASDAVSAKVPKSSKPKARQAKTAEVKASKATQVENTAGLDGALRALQFALDKKALEPVLLDVRDLCSFCNYQLVLSGKTDRQVDAIADGIAFGLKGEGTRPLSSEGARGGQWALLDYGDFVVHVFVHAMREHYDLEGLWNDAARVAIDVPAEARIPVTEQYS